MAVEQVTQSSRVIEETQVQALRASLRGQLIRPSDADYDEARQIWNGLHDKRPALIARCSGNADVIAAVNFARDNNLLVAVRGGGHNVAGTGSCDGGIMIDLSTMTGVHVDAKRANRSAHRVARPGLMLTVRPRSLAWRPQAVWFQRLGLAVLRSAADWAGCGVSTG